MTKNLPATLLLDVARFEHAQRVGNMLAKSTMIPDHFRENLGNCVIALNFADRMGIDPFMAMTKMYVIHGKPAIETQLAIALVNKTGKFTTIQYELTGKGETRQCTAYATNKETNQRCEQTVTMAMAKAEGWTAKKGSKWGTMPDLMLQYRSAMFFARLYCPEALLGLYTREEVQEFTDMEEASNGTYIPVEDEGGETLADKVAKKKTAKKKQPDTEPDIKQGRSDISQDAQADLDAMKEQSAEKYNQAVAQYIKSGGEVATDADIEKVVVIFQEMMEAVGIEDKI